MGRKRSNKVKKCQFHKAVQNVSGLNKRYQACDRKIDNQWHGYDVCDLHRRLLQDNEINKLAKYQKWEEQTEEPLIAT